MEWSGKAAMSCLRNGMHNSVENGLKVQKFSLVNNISYEILRMLRNEKELIGSRQDLMVLLLIKLLHSMAVAASDAL